MNKQTKILLGVGLVGVAIYLIVNKSKENKCKEGQVEITLPCDQAPCPKKCVDVMF
jgi:hypothetical protein